MHVTRFEEPWTHYQISDILTTNELSTLRAFSDSLDAPADGQAYKYFLGTDQLVKDNEEIESQEIACTEILTSAFTNILNTLEIVVEDSHAMYFEYMNLSPGFNWDHIHPDSPEKLFSFSLHVSATGRGTDLYTFPDSDIEKTIPWNPGGGFGFARTDTTYHNFQAPDDSDSNRITVNLFLADKALFDKKIGLA
jgi:hypothetical protein